MLFFNIIFVAIISFGAGAVIGVIGGLESASSDLRKFGAFTWNGKKYKGREAKPNE